MAGWLKLDFIFIIYYYSHVIQNYYRVLLSAPCNTFTFEVDTLQFNRIPSDAWENFNKTNTTAFDRSLVMYFTTADVNAYSSERMIDLPTFISSTGGNLGLFLGFSFMGILFSIYEGVQQQFLMKTQGSRVATRN